MFLVKQVDLKQLLSSRDGTIKMNACMSSFYFVPYSTEVSRSITSWIKTIFKVNLKNLRDQVYILSMRSVKLNDYFTDIEQITRIFMCWKLWFDLLVYAWMGITNSMSKTNQRYHVVSTYSSVFV